jgi:uncharacterized FlaG/YvyC family protein
MNLLPIHSPITNHTTPTSVTNTPDNTKTNGTAVHAVTPLTEAAPPPLKDIEKAVTTLNDFATANNSSVSFYVDDSTKKIVITVRDTITNMIIRQIPDNEVIGLSKAIGAQQGTILKTKV